MSESHFKIKLGRIHTPDGQRQFIRLARHIRFGARRKSGRSPQSRSTRKSGAQYFQRRVIVKFSLVKMNAQGKARQAQHLDYIARESAAPETEKDLDLIDEPNREKGSRLFGPYGRDIDPENFIENGANDPHQFRIIVSPEDSHRLASLEIYTGDLMRQMEQDLGTKLDWAAAAHFDTANPHVHIVLRGVKDNGKRLIIPRRYIAYGLREQAERLVSLELGPMKLREAGQKIAQQVTQERLTGLDRSLLKSAENNIVDLGGQPKKGESWTRRLDIARLDVLTKMGLAQKLPKTQWQLEPELEKTLRQMGERGDILKAYHKALKSSGLTRHDLGDIIYDPERPNAPLVLGKIVKLGVRDDVNDKAYAVLDTASGQSLYIPMGGADNLEDFTKGDILEITPNRYTPKPSDLTIEKIASRHGGIYNTAFHMETDPSARPKYLEAHVRRLEALRRAHIVTRLKDGSWKVPSQYLEKVGALEGRKIKRNPVRARLLARGQLQDMSKLMGRTWLDQQLMTPNSSLGSTGFSHELRSALQSRRQFLVGSGVLNSGEGLSSEHLKELERRDLKDAAKKLEESLGKSYKDLPDKGTVKGRYTDQIKRPSRTYALIERSKEFSLAPWRDVMEKHRGMEIVGDIQQGRISWNTTYRQRLDLT